MELRDLVIFGAVAEAGGIVEAAGRLHRVQSDVTTRIEQLEQSVGVPLSSGRKGDCSFRRRWVRTPAHDSTQIGHPRMTMNAPLLFSQRALRLKYALKSTTCDRRLASNPGTSKHITASAWNGAAARVDRDAA